MSRHSEYRRWSLLVLMALLPYRPLWGASVAKRSAQLIGGLESAPTWEYGRESFKWENIATLGVALSPKFSLRYSQEIFIEQEQESEDSLGVLRDGYLAFRVHELSPGTEKFPLKLDYEARVYLPTHFLKREAGFIGSLRNDLLLTRQISDHVSLTFAEIPIFYLYSEAGSQTAPAAYAANPIFENRFELTTKVALGEKTHLSVPLKFASTKFQDYLPNAENNSNWTTSFGMEVELKQGVHPNISLGLRFRSGNLLEQTVSGYTLGEPFSQGALQALIWLEM